MITPYGLKIGKVGKIVLLFLKEVPYVHQCCIYLIKNTVKQ